MSQLEISARDCATMTDVRREIDRIDRMLVTLLAERQTYIECAAVLKQSRDLVHDGARIEDVVAKVLASARSAGLSAEIAEPVWRLLIAQCIVHEMRCFDRLGRSADTSG